MTWISISHSLLRGGNSQKFRPNRKNETATTQTFAQENKMPKSVNAGTQYVHQMPYYIGRNSNSKQCYSQMQKKSLKNPRSHHQPSRLYQLCGSEWFLQRGGGATDAAAQNFNRLASSPSWSLGCSAFAYRKTHRSINGISKMMGVTKAA